MSSIQQVSVRNRLLKAMSGKDYELLQPHLTLVPSSLRSVLIAPNTAIEHLYFPEEGFTSVTIDASGSPVEVGMIGSEGLVGASPVMLGTDLSPLTFFVQMPGENLRIAIKFFKNAVEQSTSLQRLLFRYIQAFLIQTAQTAFVNATYDIEVRLARWILMCHDRTQGDNLSITHEFLSMMLGVRRPGVTVAVQILEGGGLIKAQRGQIRILSREGLIALAAESYGLPEAEYQLLIETP